MKLATLVAADVRFLSVEIKNEIKAATPVPFAERIDELIAFQKWSEFATSLTGQPQITRAAVVVQNYICFVYLKDSCFEVVATKAAVDSAAARVSKYLSQGAIRDFRNAFSHANWQYKKTPLGMALECWVLVDARNRAGPMRRFIVSQQDLTFWQTLARGAAYAIYEQLRD